MIILFIISSKSSNTKDQVPPTVPTASIDIEITMTVGFNITEIQFIFRGSTKNLKIAITRQYEIEATLTTNSEIRVGLFISSCKADRIAHLEDLYKEIKVSNKNPKKGKDKIVEFITSGTPCIARYPQMTTLKASEIEVELSPANIQVVKIRITDDPKVIKNVQRVTKSPAVTTLCRCTGVSITNLFYCGAK